jgi:DnaJ family protein B protein 12
MTIIEGNVDASEQCVDLASKEISNGNLEKAEKLLVKALKLYPSNKKAELILEKLKAGRFNDRSQAKGTAKTTTDGLHQRRRPTTAPKVEEPKLGEDYTQEQLETVQKIKKCKDYYEVLGITKESTDSEIKKAYKKLALQLHPDKNKAPGSVEAFKAIGNAVAVLTDAEKRKNYDLYGKDEQSIRRTNSFNTYNGFRTHEYAYARGFESEFTAEELFNMFFGGGFPQQATQTRYRRYQHHNEAQSGQSSLAFGLILLFIIVSMLSTFFQSDPMYNLSPSSKYPVERKTLNHRIPYYVKENFGTEYQGSLGRLESAVEEEYIMNMKRACFSEKNYREAMMSRARSFGSRTQYAQAQALKTPSCDALYRFDIRV